MPLPSYPTLWQDEENLKELKEHLCEVLEVDILEPWTKPQETLAKAMGAFSSFVFDTEPVKCQTILEQAFNSSVGELQGGTNDYIIYRASFPSCLEEEQEASQACAVALLLTEFYASPQGRPFQNILTLEKLRQYMLTMCQRRGQREGCHYHSLGNCMLVIQFGGPTPGQVRHIDNMMSNVQICTYMSSDCPTTIVYEMKELEDTALDGSGINSCLALLEHWQQQQHDTKVPPLLVDLFATSSWPDQPLQDKWFAKFFAFWGTLNAQLHCFGRLYQPVAYQHGLTAVEPGTTLLAGGNEVHAGPPCPTSRMFAFAIGIPQEQEAPEATKRTSDNGAATLSENGEENEGEVQYSPVMFHVDLCCLLFSILDHDYASSSSSDDIIQAKVFIIKELVAMVQEQPSLWYLRQLDEDRRHLLVWLGCILDNLDSSIALDGLIQQAVESDQIFYSPDVVAKRKRSDRRSKKKRVKGC